MIWTVVLIIVSFIFIFSFFINLSDYIGKAAFPRILIAKFDGDLDDKCIAELRKEIIEASFRTSFSFLLMLTSLYFLWRSLGL